MTPHTVLATGELHRFGLEVGSSAVLGGIAGFASKKIAKLLLVVIGLELALLQALELHGIIEVRWDAINAFVTGVQRTVEQEYPPPDLMAILSSLSVGGGFVGGFAVGFKRA